MGAVFDVEERWPELFAPLDQVQKHAVLQTLAAGWHEGWNPTRQDVVNLIDHAQGVIDNDEYLHRSREAARQAVGVAVSHS